MTNEWILIGAAVVTAGVAGAGLTKKIMNGRIARARQEGAESASLKILEQRQEQHEKEDRGVHKTVAVIGSEVTGIKEELGRNRDDHRLIFRKLDDIPDAVVKRLKQTLGPK